MELQACEMADKIHPFIQSFGNHNTSIATSATAELAKYNIWHKKYFGTSRNLVNRTSEKKDFLREIYLYITQPDEMGANKVLWGADSRIKAYLLLGEYYNVDNPQHLSPLEIALCYGMRLDYDKITQMRNQTVQNVTKPEINQEFMQELYKLNLISRFKILDTSIYSLYETDVLTDDKLTMFSVSNISDHIIELLALGECPSNEFSDVIDTMIQMTRNNDTPIFKIVEQYAFLPHTLEIDLITNCEDNQKSQQLADKIQHIREKYVSNSQDVTDATTFTTRNYDDDLYEPQSVDSHDVVEMSMYG